LIDNSFTISLLDDLKSLRVLRNQMLRPSQTIESCIFPHDDVSIHLGLKINQTLISIISFSKQNLENYSDYECWQFRGMATLKDYSRMGYGKKILKAAITIVKDNNADIFWCNARESALDFYKKLNFNIISKRFLIPESGPHYRMMLKLNDVKIKNEFD
tara:strand:+ start:31 stop:507 length:477 start_codon:yes stop_codon:yes gene_type:complete